MSPLVAYPHLAWCLERKIPVGRRPFSQAGRRRSSFSGDEEQSPPPYPAQGPARPRPRTHFHLTHKSGNGTLLKTKPALHCKYPGLFSCVCVCVGGVYEGLSMKTVLVTRLHCGAGSCWFNQPFSVRYQHEYFMSVKSRVVLYSRDWVIYFDACQVVLKLTSEAKAPCIFVQSAWTQGAHLCYSSLLHSVPASRVSPANERGDRWSGWIHLLAGHLRPREQWLGQLLH